MFLNQGGDMAEKTGYEAAVAQEIIETKIFIVRGKKVMLDSDLAELYGVLTKYLIKQVRRNIDRFPDDFMFVLDEQEVAILRFQFGSSRWGGRRTAPYVFTEQGVAMLSSVLNSTRAIHVNIQIMRTFTKIREMLASNEELRRKIEAMEKKYDDQFNVVFAAIKELLTPPPEPPKRRIGFHHDD
jgi:hypothetical protein